MRESSQHKVRGEKKPKLHTEHDTSLKIYTETKNQQTVNSNYLQVMKVWGNSDRLYFLGLQNHCIMETAAMKLKDVCSLEEKL